MLIYYSIFLFVLVCLIVSIFLLIKSTPNQQAVHGARASIKQEDRAKVKTKKKFFKIPIAEDGQSIPLDNKFIGYVYGNSASEWGISNDASFIAEYITQENKESLTVGDIVVINDKAAHSHINLRLRKIKSLTNDGTILEFSDSKDEEGEHKPHQNRNIDKVEAKITHILK